MGTLPKVIFFDAGGTLFHPFPSVGVVYARVGSRYGCQGDARRIEEVFRKVWHKHDGMSDLTQYSDEKVEKEWWRRIVSEVFGEIGGITDFNSFFDELFHVFADPEVWRLYPETREVLEELRKRNYRLAIISNWDSRLFRLIEGLQLGDYFEFVLASAVFGASKPNPRIFEEGLKRMNAAGTEAIHVGDSIEDDIKGALAAGIGPVLINRDSGLERQWPEGFGNISTIRSLSELLTL